MNTKRLLLSAVLATVTLSSAALASPACTTEPQSKWLSENAMKKIIADLGYKNIKVFHKTKSCYEIYGYTADGKKAEVYFNPVTGKVFESNLDGNEDD
jgi:hypothetical protein